MLRQRNWSPAELKAFVRGLAARDPELVDSIGAERPESAEGLDPAARALWDAVGGPESAGGEDLGFESIILVKGRPVLPIVRNEVELQIIDDAAAEMIRQRLRDAAPNLMRAIPAIGRIELSNNPDYEWVGTGWLIADGLLATNRHVAEIFAMSAGARFIFRPGLDPTRPQTARIDFLEEIGRDEALEVGISGILWVSPPSGPDVALLRLAAGSPDGVRPIELEVEAPAANTQVCVIGYPARDSRVPDSELMDRLYGSIYDKKRLAPGQIIDASDTLVRHDCTTLGGNSGSVVLSLATGRALALHYSGTYMRANYAVPAIALSQLLRDRPWQGRTLGGRPAEHAGDGAASDSSGDTLASAPKAGSAVTGISVDPTNGGLRLTVPLTIDLRLGIPLDGGGASTGAAVATPSPAALQAGKKADLAAAVDAIRSRLLAGGEAASVRAGYVFRDGWITDQKAIVVRERPGAGVSRDELSAAARKYGFPIDVRQADPTELMQADHGVTTEAPHAYISNYQRKLAGKFRLDPIEEQVTLLCHASPDAAWPTLRDFLGRIRRDFVLGMYDLSAPHIVEKLEEVLAGSGARRKSFKLVLDPKESYGDGTKADDLAEEDVIARLSAVKGLTFREAFAPTSGPSRLFDSAYHIKVSVRDGEEVWLSSGNWQSSNQPDIADLSGSGNAAPLRTYNREWHVLATGNGIASAFKAHLEQDLEDAEAVAELPDMAKYPDVLVPLSYLEVPSEELPSRPRYFAPLPVEGRIRIHPLLTPDNYGEPVVKLIEGARRQILFQNQSFKPGLDGNHGEVLDDLLQAILRKQRDGLDVRIIFRKIGDVAGTLERIKDYGFDTDRTKIRVQTNCHNKGIVVDRSKVLVGSHNWTTAGTRYNRDASLIIEDVRVADYFAELFEFDWQRLSRSRVEVGGPSTREASEVRLVDPTSEAPIPRGYVRMSWFEWNGE